MRPRSVYPKVVALVGPTASGKTDLALLLAKRFHGFVISADSRQLYKGMTIGTAKPALFRPRMLCLQRIFHIARIRHFMLDLLSPAEMYSAALYQKTVYEILACMYRRFPKQLPLIVGGTGLYIDAVTENWVFPSVPPHIILRKKMEKQSSEVLLQRLHKLDPDTAAHIDIHNQRRLVRALEYVLSEKRSFLRAQRKEQASFQTLLLGITVPRKILYERIDKRVDTQIQQGLLQEVRELVDRYGWTLPLLNTIGYREFRTFFEGEASLESTITLIKRNVRRYAKRQLTWWRKKPVHWITKPVEAINRVEKFLKEK